MERIHGCVLEGDWKFIGIICLPNLNDSNKNQMCTKKSICPSCKGYVLVGDMNSALKSLFESEFSVEQGNWESSYKTLMGRLAAFVHLAPATTSAMEQITGTSKQVLGGYSDQDCLVDLCTVSASELVRWKKSDHRGSPTNMMFLNRNQLTLFRKTKLAFIADFSVGKTTLLKTKAASLVKTGQEVTLFFLGAVDDWGKPTQTESVMDVINKIDQSNVQAMSAQDLLAFYKERNWGAMFWTPHALTLLKFYLQNNVVDMDSVMVDECPMVPST